MIPYTSSVPKNKSPPFCVTVPGKANDFHDYYYHFSNSPWCLLFKEWGGPVELAQMWPQQPGDLEKSNFEKPQNRKKWAKNGKNQNFQKSAKNPILVLLQEAICEN